MAQINADGERREDRGTHAETQGRQECGGVHAILLDGVADLVGDVNDASRCNAFVARLHDTAISHDCPIVNVIHFNPGSEKTRGHLGSQLERKAETNLRLEKTGEITEIYSEKQRRAPILKGAGVCFRWNDDAAMHLSTLHPKEAKALDMAHEHATLVDEIFGDRPSMRYKELIEALKTSGHSRTTAERRVSSWLAMGLIEKAGFGLYVKHIQPE